MRKIIYRNLSVEEKKLLLKRPALLGEEAYEKVKKIVYDVKQNGLNAALSYSIEYDNCSLKNIKATEEEFFNAEKEVSDELKEAINIAYQNIYSFHISQKHYNVKVETRKGVVCEKKYLPIEKVGLYIPGGEAPLVSTVLMLSIPAKVAGCEKIIIASPAKNNFIHPSILYASKFCGVDEVLKIGGAQAIALLAYGDEKNNFEKVYKIFGPGNQYVNLAKLIVASDIDGCAIDMPSGPSEILIIADDNANSDFVAADLLSQAEHGKDSQSILCCVSEKFADETLYKVDMYCKNFSKFGNIKSSLENSFAIVFGSIKEAIDFSNEYAPEHLSLQIKEAEKYIDKVKNAGSVFIGEYSPESAGDYASGTNHSLPTYGRAKAYGGVSLDSFMKSITFQQLSKEGLREIIFAIQKLAEAEGLEAHKFAADIRLKQ